MTSEEDRRNGAAGRRLSDNQLIQWRREGEAAHSGIEKNISENHASIAQLVDELTAFRGETRSQFQASRQDRDALKASLDASQEENRRQFAGIGECIGDLKSWQADQDQKIDQSIEHKARREQYEDGIYQEMLANFTFTRKLRKVLWSLVIGIGVIFGLAHTSMNLWGEIKHLFQGTP